MTDQLLQSEDADKFPQPVLPRLYERDIDVLLQEELIFNREVAQIFSTALGLTETLEVRDCRLSVSDHTGETDVFVMFRSGRRHGALLIENKIDAAFQPRQPERYRERASSLAANVNLDFAFCVLVAPKTYVHPLKDGVQHFDAVVPYEDIAAAVAMEPTPRAKHRASLLLRAVEEARASYTMAPVAEVGDLWQRIFRIASEEFPALAMSPPGEKGANSNWIIFKADLPPRMAIDWKITKPSLELPFWEGVNGAPSSDIDLTGLPGARWQLLGKTTVIGIPAPRPPLKWTELSDGQIREGLAGAARLLEFYKCRIARV